MPPKTLWGKVVLIYNPKIIDGSLAVDMKTSMESVLCTTVCKHAIDFGYRLSISYLLSGCRSGVEMLATSGRQPDPLHFDITVDNYEGQQELDPLCEILIEKFRAHYPKYRNLVAVSVNLSYRDSVTKSSRNFQ